MSLFLSQTQDKGQRQIHQPAKKEGSHFFRQITSKVKQQQQHQPSCTRKRGRKDPERPFLKQIRLFFCGFNRSGSSSLMLTPFEDHEGNPFGE